MGASKWSAAAVAAILSTTSLVSANPLRYCPPGAPNRAVCLEYAIPDATARNGAGNVYFKISAPTSMAWAAFGTGDGMSGANIFVLYQDGKGNVTLSPRTTTGHNPPQLDSSATGAKLTLLSGSGVSGDTMTAVVRCSNCLSWSNGGSMRAADNAAPFISAWKAGSSLATTNQAQGISRHDGRDIFGLDLTQARIAQDSNPFVTGQTGNPSNPSSPNTPTSPGNAPNDAGVTTFAGPNMAILAAHGIVMAIAFVLLYPLGSLLMAIVRKWQLHAASQMVAYLLMWAGLALGVVAANERKTLFANDAKTHTILGVVVVALLGVQPVLGWLHHMHFVKNQRRGVISHLHIWYGRILLIIGVINGGIGLRIASASYPMIIAYAVVAGVVYVLYAAGSVFGEFRRKKQAPLLKESVSPPYQQQPY